MMILMMMMKMMMFNKVPIVFLLLLFGFVVVSIQAINFQEDYDDDNDDEEIYADNPDLITELPGLNFNISFRQYSGYLQGEDGVSLHYWLYESKSNSSIDPVVFWFTGGPGGSSLLAALTEQGPFRINSSHELLPNDFAWNERANMIFLESPAGVGYSIKKDRNYTTDDDLTAENNFAAIKSFFKKYPHLADNDFYLTGESYAGIYVPTLAVLCLKNKFPKNFKGISIGNPLLDWDLNENSVLHYYYHHALINDNDWIQLNSICCPNEQNYRNCNYRNSKNQEKCDDYIKKILDFQLTNPYNIYDEFLNQSLPASSRLKSSQLSMSMMNPSLIHNEQRWITSRLIENYHKNYVVMEKENPKKTDETAMIEWMNKPDVRKALHIDPSAGKWNINNYDLIQYHEIYHTMKSQLNKLINGGIRVTIYNGDFDAVCCYLGDRWFVEDLGYNATSEYMPWYFGTYDFDQRLAGFQIKYGNLTYKTVLAAGHMVPMDQPGPAQTLFHDFLSNK